MPDRSYRRRLARYAVCSSVQVLVVVAIVLGGAGFAAYGVAALLLVSLPLLWAWGAFQAEVAMNPYLDDVERARWRILLACLPGSMAVYWYRHVRP
jgi:hypothetical protein